jgi:hypothetical protein
MNSETPLLFYQFPKPKRKIIYHCHWQKLKIPWWWWWQVLMIRTAGVSTVFFIGYI